MPEGREATRVQERLARERLGVDARQAIQNARFWTDRGDAQRARAWASRAAELTNDFRLQINAELIP